MRDFLERLFTNPNFLGQPTSVIEHLIINFIDKNASGLQPIFKSEEYFPDKEWDETRGLLINELQTMVIEELKPRLKEVMDSKLDFSALEVLAGGKTFEPAKVQSEVWEFYEKILTGPDVRLHADNMARLIEGGLIESYIEAAAEKQSYTYNQLFRGSGISLSPQEYTEVLKVCALLRPMVFISVPEDMTNTQKGTFEYSQAKGTTKFAAFCENLEAVLRASLPSLPDHVIDILIESIIDWDGDERMAAGRFLNIMAGRAKDLRLNQKVATGGDTPDKTWFSIAMRNAGVTGQDKSMLEDLSRLAFELRL